MSFNDLKQVIEEKLEEAIKTLKTNNYDTTSITPTEFYNYMTGEIFSEDETTINDVLASLNLMIHEVIEINELKKQGKTIDKQVIIDSPRELIYKVHLKAMEYELDYLQKQGETKLLKKRLHAHYKVLTTDPNLPEDMKPLAQRIWDKHRE